MADGREKVVSRKWVEFVHNCGARVGTARVPPVYIDEEKEKKEKIEEKKEEN